MNEKGLNACVPPHSVWTFVPDLHNLHNTSILEREMARPACNFHACMQRSLANDQDPSFALLFSNLELQASWCTRAGQLSLGGSGLSPPGSWKPIAPHPGQLTHRHALDACALHSLYALAWFFFFLSQSSSQAQARQSCERWKMAGKLDPSKAAPPVVLEEAEGIEGKWASGGQGRRKGGFVPLQ